MRKYVIAAATVALLSASAQAQMIGLDFYRGNLSGWNEVNSADLTSGGLTGLKAVDGGKTDASVSFAGSVKGVSYVPASFERSTIPDGLQGINGYLYTAGSLTVAFKGLSAGAVYNVYVIASATAVAKPPKSQAVTLTGKKTVSFTQTCPAVLQLIVNDQIGSSGQPLSSYKKSVPAADDGTLSVTVKAMEDSWRIAGIAVEKAGETP